MNHNLTTYIKKLNQHYDDGTEHTHRPALVDLLEESAEAINEPGRKNGNMPDLLIKNSSKHTIGFIETKKINADLNKALKTEQLKRYLTALPNLLLTDYVDFIWLKEGKEMGRAAIGEIKNRKIVGTQKKQAEWENLISNFLKEPAIGAGTPDDMATYLSERTRWMKDIVLKNYDNAELGQQRENIRKYLLPNIQKEDFSDMFSQTLSYGLFTARCFDNQGINKSFTRHNANEHIPPSNPFLQHLFHFITGPDLPNELGVLLDDICSLLGNSDMTEVMAAQSKKLGFEDPIFHFYETFLAKYDPKLKEQRGVFYTPEPVVEFIVRGVDDLLKTHFDKRLGLADEDTIILDPACGTGTFMRSAIKTIHDTFTQNQQKGRWQNYVNNNLLERFFGFELMMAPYTVAHLKIAKYLQETGYTFEKQERVNVFLTNALEKVKAQTQIAYDPIGLAKENALAQDVKDKKPVMVVLGNPPYSGHSANEKSDITAEEYKKEPDGSKLKEKNPKWLNDDYVKFTRFAQERVLKTGYGVVGFIANHAWVDNLTFRGMRNSLLQDFDEIYICNLHGNSKQKEKTPEGEKDENVFDIQQGVAIFFLIRRQKNNPKGAAKVFYRDMWGKRNQKYEELAKASLGDGAWEEIKPELPRLEMKKIDAKYKKEYETDSWFVKDLFNKGVSGIITSSDDLVFAMNKKKLSEKIKIFLDPSISDDEIRAKFFPKAQTNIISGRSIGSARNELQQTNWQKEIKQCLYRPFDIRFLLYNDNIIHRTRKKVMKHMLDDNNLGIITTRQIIGEAYSPVFITNIISEGHIISNSKSISYFYPLYLQDKNKTLYSHWKVKGKLLPNLDIKFVEAFEAKLKLQFIAEGESDGKSTFSPRDILNYAYAIFHSPTYRKRYVSFLKYDFPRLPLTSNKKLFFALSKLGAQLIDYHLLKHSNDNTISYPESGSDEVTKITYKKGRVYLNQTQYFGNVAQEDYIFQIGGYQVLDKWLKSRKGEKLQSDDFDTYQKIVIAIRETRRIMAEVDSLLTFPLP